VRSGTSALDSLRGDIEDAHHLGDPLPSDATMLRTLRKLTVETEPGTFLTGNFAVFVGMLANEAAASAAAAYGRAEAALAQVLSGEASADEEAPAKLAAAAAVAAQRAAADATTMAAVEQMLLVAEARALAEASAEGQVLAEASPAVEAEEVEVGAALGSRKRKVPSKKAKLPKQVAGAVLVAAPLSAAAAKSANLALQAAAQAHAADEAVVEAEMASRRDAITNNKTTGVAMQLQVVDASAVRVSLKLLAGGWNYPDLHAIAQEAAAGSTKLEEWVPPVEPIPVSMRADATDIREETYIDRNTGSFWGDVNLKAIDSVNPEALQARFKLLRGGLRAFMDGDEAVRRQESAAGLQAGALTERSLVEALAFFCEEYDRIAGRSAEVAAEKERKEVAYEKTQTRRAQKSTGKAKVRTAKANKAVPQRMGAGDASDTSVMSMATAKLLVTRLILTTLPDSDDPTTIYGGVVLCVHTPEEAGVADEVWLLVRYEDGYERSYTMADILSFLVPFAEMKPRKEKLLQVSNPALSAELAARGLTKGGSKAEMAARLDAALAAEEEDGDSDGPQPQPQTDANSDDEEEPTADANSDDEEEPTASSGAGDSGVGGAGPAEAGGAGLVEAENEEELALQVAGQLQATFNTGQKKQLALLSDRLYSAQRLTNDLQLVLDEAVRLGYVQKRPSAAPAVVPAKAPAVVLAAAAAAASGGAAPPAAPPAPPPAAPSPAAPAPPSAAPPSAAPPSAAPPPAAPPPAAPPPAAPLALYSVVASLTLPVAVPDVAKQLLAELAMKLLEKVVNSLRAPANKLLAYGIMDVTAQVCST